MIVVNDNSCKESQIDRLQKLNFLLGLVKTCFTLFTRGVQLRDIVDVKNI